MFGLLRDESIFIVEALLMYGYERLLKEYVVLV